MHSPLWSGDSGPVPEPQETTDILGPWKTPAAFTSPRHPTQGLLAHDREGRGPLLDRDLWGPSGSNMPLEIMTLLSLWPGVKDPGFCLVIGGDSEWGRVQSQTRSKGRKRKEVPFHPHCP